MKKWSTEKLFKVMKICTIQWAIAITLCGMALAFPNHAQLLERKISVDLSNASFEDALREIEIAAHVKFAYSITQLRNEHNVTLTINNGALGDVLNSFLSPRNIAYKVHERESTITLKKSAAANRETKDDMTSTPRPKDYDEAVQQVAGVITDAATSIPIAGVNILIKGSSIGTTTDVEGRYVIVADRDDILVFSFIGYATVEVPVHEQTVIDIKMVEDIKSLGEVIVNAGYWEVKDREQTGNISKLPGATIAEQPVSNPLQAMQGRMPGVYIQQNTGMPGGGFEVMIRGQNSLRTGTNGTANGNLPLYLVDGVPFTSSSLTSTSLSSSNLQGGNPLSMINPNDIESIEVLKDADATSIYGSRGSNGVILITTKKGQKGKPSVTLDFSQGVGQVSNSIGLLSTPQYLDLREEAIMNDGLTDLLEDPAYDLYWPDLKLWDTNRYTDWQEELIGGNASITNGQLSVSGGSAKTQFIVSGSYYRETTVFEADNAFQRFSGLMNINHTSDNDRFNLVASASYSSTATSIPNFDLTSSAVSLPPNAPALYDEQGNLNWENSTWINPMASMEREYLSDIDNFVGSVGMTYELLEGLDLKASLGFTSMHVDETTTSPLTSFSPEIISYGVTAYSSFGDSRINTWIAEPQMSYSRKLGGGVVNVLVGGTFQESVQEGKTIDAGGYTSDALLENINAATTIDVTGATYSQYRYNALFGRINYTWGDRYIVNLTGRRDGSSRFGPGKRFANFGAAGVAWIFSEERWLKGRSGLSFGKLRTSYGTTGSDAIGDYQYLDTYSPTTYPYAGTTGLYVTRLANPDYSWEANTKFEVAADFGFLNDRIRLSTAWYYNESTSQLVGFPLPVMTGQPSVQFNLPATVVNRGWEVLLSALILKKGRIEWNADFNFTIPTNELTEFPDLEKFPVYANRYDVGQSLFVIKGYEYIGVDPQTGVYTFVDRNKDGVISSPQDRVGLKSVSQKYFGGITNSIKINSFQFDFFFQFVNQTGYSYMNSFSFPGDRSNQPVEVMNRWRQAGDDAVVQRATVFDLTGEVLTADTRNKSSDNIVTDASFVRLKSASLSWIVPTNWSDKLRLRSARVYVRGQNLFTFTQYIGMDPETQNSFALPPLRVITAGLTLTL